MPASGQLFDRAQADQLEERKLLSRLNGKDKAHDIPKIVFETNCHSATFLTRKLHFSPQVFKVLFTISCKFYN